MRISDWSSDVCSSDLPRRKKRIEIAALQEKAQILRQQRCGIQRAKIQNMRANCDAGAPIDPIPTEYPQRQVLDGEISVRRVRALRPAFSGGFVRRVDRHHVGSLDIWRSDEQTSELQSLMRLWYVVFGLIKTTTITSK